MTEAIPVADPSIALADFGHYRMLCDTGGANYRKAGISTEDEYRAATHDERTVFAAVSGSIVPAIVAAEHDHEYDADRCARLMNDPNPRVLAVPLSLLVQDEAAPVYGHGRLSDNRTLNVVVPHDATDAQQPESLVPLTTFGQYAEQNFVHPDIADAAHATAWLGLYSARVEPKERAMTTRMATFDEAWSRHCLESGIDLEPPADAGGAFMFNSTQLKERSDVVDELWALTETGFGEVLGAHHPLSMEEGGRKVFEELFLAEDTHTIVHYRQGKAVCFGALTTNADNWPWLNPHSPTIQAMNREAADGNATPVYFSALIGDAGNLGSSAAVLGLAYEMTGRIGRSTELIFESTNLSAMYVPRLTELLARRSAYADMHGGVRQLGRVAYRHVTLEL